MVAKNQDPLLNEDLILKASKSRLKDTHPFKKLEPTGYDALNDREKLLYLSGCFDGEGSFGFWSTGKGKSRIIMAKVETTDADMVARFQEYFGGWFWHIKSRNVKHKEAFRWKLTGEQAWKALKAMIPYMCLRRREKFYGLVKPIGYGSEDWGSHLQKQTRIKEVNE